MRFVVDLERVVVILADPEDLTQVSVVVAAPGTASAASPSTVHRLAEVLAATNVGTIGADGTATLRADAVRFHAAGQVGGEWERRFAELCRDDEAGSVVAAAAPVFWPAGSA